MLHPAVALIFSRPFLLLISPDLFLPPTYPAHPTVSPGTATKAANGEGMYLHTVTDGEIQRERERGRGTKRHTGKKREGERNRRIETGGGGTVLYGAQRKKRSKKLLVMLPK